MTPAAKGLTVAFWLECLGECAVGAVEPRGNGRDGFLSIKVFLRLGFLETDGRSSAKTR